MLFRSAVANSRLNGLDGQARFECAPVGEVLAERLGHLGRPTRLLLDPPRKGLDPEALEAITTALPSRIAYLSCDPATLARDLGRLQASGRYRIEWVQPIDFFPNTSHVECLAVLQLLDT